MSDCSLALALLAFCVHGDLRLTVLRERHTHALTLRQRDADVGLRPADDEDVTLPRRESIVVLVLDVDDIEGPRVPLDINDLTDAASVGAAGDHALHAGLE